MTKYRPQPPWEFLASASRNMLQSYELSRLGHASNLRKEITDLLDQWLEENTSAMLARWLINQRVPAETAEQAEAAPAAEETIDRARYGSDNFLANCGAPPRSGRARR